MKANNQIFSNNSYDNNTNSTVIFRVHPMNPADAVQVVALMHACYGNSYCYKPFYDPANLIQANEKGDLKSVVATTNTGEVIGHMALMRTDDPHLIEPVIAMVKPTFRNMGVLTKLAEYLYVEKESELKEFTGIYILPVTKHIFSQKQVYHHGFKDCGLWLCYSPNVQFKEITTDSIQRLTLVSTYKYITKPKEITIYSPQQHKDIIIKLFRNIGVTKISNLVPKDHYKEYVKMETTINLTINKSLGQAKIKILEYGHNIVSKIRTTVSKLCSQNLSVIHLYLSLNDPVTYHATPEFEKMGFFFAGIMPGTACKDTLILQYLNHTKIDYSKILLANDTARELLAYIVEKRKIRPLL